MKDLSNAPFAIEGTSSQQKKTKKNTRGATMMTTLTNVCKTGVKMQIKLDMQTCRCYGENASTFMNYISIITRWKQS